ncbi:MAG: AMP-binding protein [Actinomycetota bacterium]|jgi:acyl-CoA synthetase (AMP-forming)/AMP-acid ligase II|nr:AMP-binding protein [Ilumatobacteraceae bacterium]MDA2960237.1 AMP-binding protein [Actinomycetota bacterium]MDA3007679.1 AMP-binding protein [Actinomycetota bacterium]MDA3035235.1 AMP-binding protein [Actinomycetota bacterium]
MIIHTSPLPSVVIPEVPITEFVLRRAAIHPDRPALIDGTSGRVITFAELDDQIHRLAGGLRAAGFTPGDVLALMAPNVPEYAVVFHAVAVAGGTVTTVNPTYGASEVAFQLADAGASVLVTIGAFADVAREATATTNITEIITIDGADGTTALSTLVGDRIEQHPVDVFEQLVVLPYSSGTTGLPKGVMLSHHNLVANICQCEHAIVYEPDGELALAFLPFFHIYGMQVLMNGLLANGVTVVTLPRFDLEQALGLIQQHRITRLFAVPPVVLALAKHPLVDTYDLSSLTQVFSGAAPLGAELAQEASARIGCEVVQGYGMTELSPVSHTTPPGMFKPGTSGVTVSNTESRIVDPDTGEDQPVGGRGELWVRGPLVMRGYLNNPEATAATIDADGWLHTGDVAVIDEDGHMTIVDRVKELIKYKGFQVPPAELEALLVTHPDVADVAVIGIPDDEAGELPKAFIVRAAGAEVAAADLQAFVAEHVATYKQIRVVEFVDEIPKSASGKILRRVLRDRG